MKTKNKFFACFKLIPISIFVFVLCVSVFFISIVVDGLPEPTYLLIIMIIILIALPAVFLIACIFVGCIMIEISEEGIATILFRKRLKFFKWEEITEVKTRTINNSGDEQILFYINKDTNARRRKTEKISFTYYCLDLSKEALLKRYAPEYIIEKLNFSTNQ